MFPTIMRSVLLAIKGVHEAQEKAQVGQQYAWQAILEFIVCFRCGNLWTEADIGTIICFSAQALRGIATQASLRPD